MCFLNNRFGITATSQCLTFTGVCYQQAKQALHTALPERLLCREKEYKEVNDFLDGCLKKKKPGSMYISGAPGTGKTAVLSRTLHRLEVSGVTVKHSNLVRIFAEWKKIGKDQVFGGKYREFFFFFQCKSNRKILYPTSSVLTFFSRI